MITYHPTGKLVTVDYDHVKSLIKNPEEYNPITLKPDLLKISGFEETEKSKWSIQLLPFLFATASGGFSFTISDKKDRYVNSLHQLQNLYFALTNEELNIEMEL